MPNLHASSEAPAVSYQLRSSLTWAPRQCCHPSLMLEREISKTPSFPQMILTSHPILGLASALIIKYGYRDRKVEFTSLLSLPAFVVKSSKTKNKHKPHQTSKLFDKSKHHCMLALFGETIYIITIIIILLYK